jgi:hypothetical protein
MFIILHKYHLKMKHVHCLNYWTQHNPIWIRKMDILLKQSFLWIVCKRWHFYNYLYIVIMCVFNEFKLEIITHRFMLKNCWFVYFFLTTIWEVGNTIIYCLKNIWHKELHLFVLSQVTSHFIYYHKGGASQLLYFGSR